MEKDIMKKTNKKMKIRHTETVKDLRHTETVKDWVGSGFILKQIRDFGSEEAEKKIFFSPINVTNLDLNIFVYFLSFWFETEENFDSTLLYYQ